MNFKSKATLVEKLAWTIIIIVAVLIVLSVVASIVFGTFFITNPEVLGEWFNRLLGGFNE